MVVGALKANQLVEVEPGIYLGTRAARAYRRAKAAFRAKGKVLSIVGRYAAYRSKDLQNKMADASRTAPGSAARAHYNLSRTSRVPVAYHPNGKHENGRAFDLLIDGSSNYPNSSDRKLLAKFGWSFPFGEEDSNHVNHDNIHGVVPVTRKWCIQNHIWVQPTKK